MSIGKFLVLERIRKRGTATLDREFLKSTSGQRIPYVGTLLTQTTYIAAIGALMPHRTHILLGVNGEVVNGSSFGSCLWRAQVLRRGSVLQLMHA